MKKLTFAIAILFAISMTACHYGQEEANKTLERNDQYKGDKAEYSVNRAGEGGKMNEKAADETVATDSTVTAEPAKAETQPAEHAEHH